MTKPVIYALRGAVGFELTILLALGGWLVLDRFWYLFGPGAITPWVIMGILLFLAGALGAGVLFYDTDRWVRAMLCFGLSSLLVPVPILIHILSASETHPRDLISGCVAWALAYALFGSVGGGCTNWRLALPGAIAFGLPELYGGLVHSTPNSALIWLELIGTPPLCGALFGYFVGRVEERV